VSNTYDVFLSHNSLDKPAVEKIARSLIEANLRVFLDKWNLLPGDRLIEELEKALEQSETVAVFVGESGISPWHNEEIRSAILEAIRTRDEYRVIPVLLPGGAEKSLPKFLSRRLWVDFRADLNNRDELDRLIAGIKGRPGSRADAVALPDDPAPCTGTPRPGNPQHAFCKRL
jgi:hypothetical protein